MRPKVANPEDVECRASQAWRPGWSSTKHRIVRIRLFPKPLHALPVQRRRLAIDRICVALSRTYVILSQGDLTLVDLLPSFRIDRKRRKWNRDRL